MLANSGDDAIGVPRAFGMCCVTYYRGNALGTERLDRNDYLAHALGDLDFLVDPLAVGGVHPGHDQYRRTRADLVFDGLLELFVGWRADNRVVRWHRKILEREVLLGVEQA